MKNRFGFIVLSTLLAFHTGSASAANTVRSNDIVDGEVKNVDIGSNAVTTDKILDGTIGSNDLANLAVSNAKIAAGAVTDAKISGVISAVKLPVGATSGTVAAGDHQHDALYQRRYGNVVVVAKSGGDFTDPIAAIASIVNASEVNPSLLRIMPGVYDLGSGTLAMKQFVDIEGSGENVTVIASSVASGEGPPTIGTVVGADNAEIRFLSVKNTISSGNVVGILNSGASPKLTHVTATATSSSNASYGIYNANSSPTMSDVTATAFGGYSYAVLNYSSSPTMNHVTATASGSAQSVGIMNQFSAPTMNDVTAIASGSGNIGVYNWFSLPIMTNITANAFGGAGSNTGIDITGSSPTMIDVVATASGGADRCVGMSIYDSSPAMTNVIATASGAPDGNHGLLIIGGGIQTILADRCTFQGDTHSIWNTNNNTTLRFGSSKLAGTVTGPAMCAVSYSGNFVPLDAACQ